MAAWGVKAPWSETHWRAWDHGETSSANSASGRHWTGIICPIQACFRDFVKGLIPTSMFSRKSDNYVLYNILLDYPLSVNYIISTYLDYLSIYLSVCLFVCLSVCHCLSIYIHYGYCRRQLISFSPSEILGYLPPAENSPQLLLAAMSAPRGPACNLEPWTIPCW